MQTRQALEDAARLLREAAQRLDDAAQSIKENNRTIEPPWLVVARREVGVKEVAGREHNPRILEYLRSTSLRRGYDKDETPWCSAFVNWCCTQAGVLRTGSARARSWESIGEETLERVGAIAVLHRGDPRSWTGHVGFLVDWDADRIKLLGGNQDNAVNEKWYPRNRLITLRWPVNR